MPGYNHYSNCTCGWCEGGWRGGTRSHGSRFDSTVSASSFAYHSSMRELAEELGCSLLFPTICRYCGQLIYLYASPNGGFVIFDSLGKPWPKHECTGVRFNDHKYRVDYLECLPDQKLPIPDYTEHKSVRRNQLLTGVVARIMEDDLVEVFDGKFLFHVRASEPVKVGTMLTGTVEANESGFVLKVTEIHQPSRDDVQSLIQNIRRTS